jgi:hypothetical protein
MWTETGSTGSTGSTGNKDPLGDRRFQVRIALIGAAGAIIAAVAGAVIGLTPWVHLSPPHGPSASQCVFLASKDLVCTSSNPEVALEANNQSSTVGCSFSDQVSWGDGSQQTFNYKGALPGPFFLGNHTYYQKSTYIITVQATVTFGSCSTSGANFTFTLSALYRFGDAEFNG